MKGEKPICIIVPTWNPDEPRFIVADATEQLSDDRKFANGKCVENQRLKIVYSVDDIVEVLNKYEDLEKEHKELERKIRILSAHLLSDECALSDSQLRKIREELDYEEVED